MSPLRLSPEPQGAPLKTRYTILDPVPETEPGTLSPKPSDLDSLTWVDCEFKGSSPTLEELHWLLDPLFPDAEGFERVAVNSFKGPTDMFVDDSSAGFGETMPLPVNGAATLIYWTASILHQINKRSGEPPTYQEMRMAALREAADLFTVNPVHTPPRIHGRAVLFADPVWR